jgi:hypothetical protein
MSVVSFEQQGSKVVFKLKVGRSGRADFPRFELVDATGNRINTGSSGGGGSGGEFRWEYSLASDTPVAAIRYEAYVGRLVVGVPLEFTGIPLPK